MAVLEVLRELISCFVCQCLSICGRREPPPPMPLVSPAAQEFSAYRNVVVVGQGPHPGSGVPGHASNPEPGAAPLGGGELKN